jgi:hypothetical protein
VQLLGRADVDDEPLTFRSGRWTDQTLRPAVSWLVIAVGVYVAGPRTFWLDDAYIPLHSARVALSGITDPVFGSPPLTGVTSPAYVAMLMGLLSVGFNRGLEALRIASALGVATQVLGLWYLAWRAGFSTFWPRIAFVVAGCGSGLVWTNATNGLETGWAMAVLVWMIAACPDSPYVVAVGAGLLPMLRPDLTPAALAVLAVAIWNRDWQTRVAAVGLSIVAAAPFLIWLRADTGNWLPQTMRAKYLFQSEGCLPAVYKATTGINCVVLGVLTMLPLSVGLVTLWKDRLGRAGLFAMTCSLSVVIWMLPSSLTHNEYRYLYPIVAPWAAYGLVRLLINARPAASSAIVLLVALIFWDVFLYSVHDPDIRAASVDERLAAAAWIDQHTPGDAVVLVHDAGLVSEFAHRRIVDFVGLKTPASIDTHAALTFPTCGARRTEAVLSIAVSSQAQYLVVETGWERVLNLEPAARLHGLKLIQVRVPASARLFGQNIYRLDRDDSPSDSNRR